MAGAVVFQYQFCEAVVCWIVAWLVQCSAAISNRAAVKISFLIGGLANELKVL